MDYKNVMIDIENKLNDAHVKGSGELIEISEAVQIVDEVMGNFMSDVRADVDKMRDILTGVTNNTIWEK